MEMRRWLTFSLSFLFASCGDRTAPLTELVVVIDSDLEVPAELDALSVRATGPDAREQSANAALGDGEPALPRALVLRHEGGALGPFSIHVEGRSQGEVVVSRDARAEFVRGQSLVLPLHLAKRCIAEQCAVGESCSENGCIDEVVDVSSLAEWSGDKPRLPESAMDAGTSADDAGAMHPTDADARDAAAAARADAGQCATRPEACNGMDDNCNGQVDETFDLSRSTDNCGRCGNQCNTRRGDVCCRGACARICL